MNRDGLFALYRYNAYANDLVLKTVAELSEVKFTQISSPSHSSVHQLLIHMLEVEAFFLSTCSSHTMEELPDDATLADILTFYENLEKETHDYLIEITDSDLSREIEVPLGDQPLRLAIWQILVQAFVHSTHHRGELSITLTELGHPLPTLDIIIQFVEQSGQKWPFAPI